ncbi:MAG: GxxExxY protein [Lentisphaerales bacterium]|nr:GxxExxY protein [Lentisphaerales bacterium]
MVIDDLTKEVIGAAFRVYNSLGSGFLESVYEKSMMHELTKLCIPAVSQKAIKVVYDGVVVGDFYADILVENRLIVELKVIQNICTANEVQLVNYLKATGIDHGLLINFGPEIIIKRKFRTYKKSLN